MTASAEKIAITGLTKRFGSSVVLDEIDLTIRAGRKSVLIGPAASGKTVLMKCISGIYPLSKGSIRIDGQTVTKAGSRAHTQLMQSVGVLFQQGGLFDGLPVWKNIGFKLTGTRGMSDEEAKRIAIEKLAMVNLPAGTADLFPAELSGGMQKRVGIARALAGEPSLLLFDEPTAGLDPITTTAINRLIDDSIRETGATVFSITSDMESARSAYDDLYMLHQGKIVFAGTTAELDTSDNAYVTQMINGRAEGPISVPLKSSDPQAAAAR